MRNELIAALMLFSMTRVGMAEPPKPVVLSGITQAGDTAELRFGSGQKGFGQLIILDIKTGNARAKQEFSYLTQAGGTDVAKGTRGSSFDVQFRDKKKLHIDCDLSTDNCRSTDYVTELGAAFSISWVITNN